jgi:hypothetical protein
MVDGTVWLAEVRAGRASAERVERKHVFALSCPHPSRARRANEEHTERED